MRYFNPRTSCEVRHKGSKTTVAAWCISIHAPHARCDGFTLSNNVVVFFKFQSTHLMRGATKDDINAPSELRISIHAPHARCDLIDGNWQKMVRISIHAPHARCDSADITKDASYTNTRKSARFLFYLRH